jgi:hypothetical protein
MLYVLAAKSAAIVKHELQVQQKNEFENLLSPLSSDEEQSVKKTASHRAYTDDEIAVMINLAKWNRASLHHRFALAIDERGLSRLWVS